MNLNSLHTGLTSNVLRIILIQVNSTIVLSKRKELENPGNFLIFIPGNIPSLKNSKVKTSRGIFSSPTVSKFLRSIGIQGFNSRKKTVKGYVDLSRPNQFEALRKDFARMKAGKDDPIIIGSLVVAFIFINSFRKASN